MGKDRQFADTPAIIVYRLLTIMQKEYPVNHIFKIDNFFFKRLDDG